MQPWFFVPSQSKYRGVVSILMAFNYFKYLSLICKTALEVHNCHWSTWTGLMLPALVSVSIYLVQRGSSWGCLVMSQFLVKDSCNLHLLMFGELFTIKFNKNEEFCLALALYRHDTQWIITEMVMSETNHAS